MKRSKRIEALDARPVNLDGYINEWPEMGFIAMNSPYDPKPSVKVEDGRIVELDGKTRDEFDFIDQFIADYAINVDRAAASMAVPSLEIARKIVDIHVSRKEILDLVAGITPAKMAEVLNQLNVVELMMGMQKMRARKVPGNQAHITNLKDDPVQIAADAAEGALRGFSEEETTMGVARYAPLSSMALLIGSQTGRPGVLTQCSAEEATELELGIRGLTTYAETLSVYGTEKVFIDGDDTPYSKAFLNSAYASRGLKEAGLFKGLGHYSFCTNGSHYAGENGIMTIGYGPGEERLAHTVDEAISVLSITSCCRGLYAILSSIHRDNA